MVLRFFILAVFLFISCADGERDNPYDPGSDNYVPWGSSSSEPSSSSVTYTLKCAAVPSTGIVSITVIPPIVTCNGIVVGYGLDWEGAPNWNNPAIGTYSNISVEASYGECNGKTASCSGALTVIAAPSADELTCIGMPMSGVAGESITPPTVRCGTNMVSSGIEWSNAPDWDNLAASTYNVEATAYCVGYSKTASCGTLTVASVLSCATVPPSGTAGTAITAPTVTCNGITIDDDELDWFNAPDWDYPIAGTYSDISVFANSGNCSGETAECSGTLTVYSIRSSSSLAPSSSSAVVPSSSSRVSSSSNVPPSSSSAESSSSFGFNPCDQTAKLSGGTTWNGTKGVTNLFGSGDDVIGVEAWTEAGGSATKLTWFGQNQGGGSAFRAEWTNSTDYLGRIGYRWGTNGKKWSDLGDLCVDYNYTRSANGTGGSYSFIGVYGWTIGSNNSSEYYIVEDWYGYGQQAANNLGNGCAIRGNITVDGNNYQVVTCIRPQGSGCVSCNNQAFGQVFSIRQGMANNPPKCGTISIKKHFEEWSKISGASQYIYDKTYESTFLVEAAGGTGWFEASYMKFSRTGACGGYE